MSETTRDEIERILARHDAKRQWYKPFEFMARAYYGERERPYRLRFDPACVHDKSCAVKLDADDVKL